MLMRRPCLVVKPECFQGNESDNRTANNKEPECPGRRRQKGCGDTERGERSGMIEHHFTRQ